MWGVAGKPRVGERDGPGKLSWIREAAPSPQTPARLQPRSREAPALPKELRALLLRLFGDPRAGTFTQYKKGAKKTQAGCKLFESFTRRGIFPVKYFFPF